MKRERSLANLYNKLERKKIKIISSINPQFWYAEMIGKEVIVFETKSDKKENLWTVDDGTFDNFIKKEDSLIIG